MSNCTSLTLLFLYNIRQKTPCLERKEKGKEIVIEAKEKCVILIK